MILVDTSVWVDHLRQGNAKLENLLEHNRVIVHPFVIGEVALGSLRQRDRIIELLSSMPRAPIAKHAEVMHFIDQRGLHGQGIGYVDVHLLASVLLYGRAKLWTADKRLYAAAVRLDIAA